MIRTLVAIAVTTTALANLACAGTSARIDLDVPGNLESVERAHPDHFAKIQKILAEVPRLTLSEHSVARWMLTEFDARDVRYTDLIMTSLPPKKRLEFSLDDTSYRKTITLSDWNAKPLQVVPPR